MIKVTSANRIANFSAQQARDELRTMAQSLIDAKGNVKSGYIKMLNGGEGEEFGTRWTRESTSSTQRALGHITELISKACEGKQDIADALKQNLNAYVATKGKRLGTQSFVKMVQVLDRLDAPERGLTTQVFNAKLKNGLTLQTQDVEQKVLRVPSRRMVVLSPEEGEQALDGLGNGLDEKKMLGSAKDPVKSIRDEGMVPEVKFSLANGSIFLSKVKSRNGRLYAQAIIALDDGRKSSVTAYQSNSQGVWRLSGHPHPAEIYKGPGEQFMTLDSEIQKHLHSQQPEGEIKQPPTSFCLVDDRDEDQYVEKSTKALQASTVKPLTVRSEGNDMTLTPPEAITINEQLRPNFAKLVDSYPADLPMHGRTTFYVYGSVNEACEYIVAQGEDGRAWVAHAGPKNADYSASGFPTQGVDFADLMSPRWEYLSQIAAIYSAAAEANPTNSKYACNWQYVKQIPLIRDWYQSRNSAVPS